MACFLRLLMKIRTTVTKMAKLAVQIDVPSRTGPLVRLGGGPRNGSAMNGKAMAAEDQIIRKENADTNTPACC
jgi:hypothetical protein